MLAKELHSLYYYTQYVSVFEGSLVLDKTRCLRAFRGTHDLR